MAQKVFVSYKYADDNVAQLPHANWWETTTVRDYVNVFMWKATSDGCVVYKGERDNEDLSYLSEDTIWNKLRDKIYDSSVLASLDVLFIPALAIDHNGMRLGKGAGYYDRALASLNPRPQTIAIVYAEEVLDAVPHDDHDQAVDLVITD